MISRISLLLSLVLLFGLSCKKDDPTVVNPNITNESATVQDCDPESEYYSILVDFDYEGADPTEEFSIGVADDKSKYGTYAFSELPVTISNLLGDNATELELNLYVPKEDSVNKQVFPLEIPQPIDCITRISHDRWNELLIANVSQAGNVNYPGFLSRFDEVQEYLRILSANPPEADWSDEETTCFYINAYNAVAVNLMLENYPIQSIMNIPDVWKRKELQIGEDTLSLDNIEKDILLPHTDYDPRIHFAVNCASKSCPPLLNRAFVPETLENDLQSQTYGFINNSSYNFLSPDSLAVSQLFNWYINDFSAIDTAGLDQAQRDAQVIQYIDQYSNQSFNEGAVVHYQEYDWSIND